MRMQRLAVEPVTNPISISTGPIAMTTLFSIVESPSQPRLDALYRRLGINRKRCATGAGSVHQRIGVVRIALDLAFREDLAFSV
jgi:plasmid replication initiation protein